MATKLPRLNVAMDAHIYHAIERLSKKEGLSLSFIARDLLREALMTYEDVFWAKEAQHREASLKKSKALAHNKIWGA